MHPAALHWAKLHVPECPRSVVDVGGMDVNCSLRTLYTWSSYVCVDIAPGPGVDVVAPFAEWAARQKPRTVDLVVSFEVLEHASGWRDIIQAAHWLLEDGGVFVGTCATGARTPHSAYGHLVLPADEYYENVSAPELALALEAAGFREYTVDVTRANMDLRWTATR